MASITLNHIVKTFDDGITVIPDLNLEIKDKEFVIFVGPSGCGKSTTLRMIAGLEDISEGEIYLENELLNYKACKDRRMAIVFQSYALYPQMSVFDNIAFPLTINKFSFPVVNEVLKANSEISTIMETIPFNKIVGALYNIYNEKKKRSEKEEDLANIFRIELASAKIFMKIFSDFKDESLENLNADEEKIRKKIERKAKNQ